MCEECCASYQQSDNLRKTTDWQLKDNSRHCRERARREGKREVEGVVGGREEGGGRCRAGVENMATVASFAKPIYHN